MILVTGASGFVGGALLERFSRDQCNAVRAVFRSSPAAVPSGVAPVVLGLPFDDPQWAPVLQDVRCVVHAAARVHVMREQALDPLAEFRAVNLQATAALARQAAAAGVRRFVFISTLKVLGEKSAPGVPLRPDDPPRPADPYGQSKREAEDALRELGASSGMEIVIVRPPLVYGPGVRANFRALMSWIMRGRPLPLGAIYNQRSLVSLANLVDLLSLVTVHPSAAGQTLHVSDGEDVSTTELLRGIGEALGRPARLLPVPPAVLRATAALVGLSPQLSRLLDSLQCDIRLTRERLGWNPVQSLRQGLRQTADAFKNEALH